MQKSSSSVQCLGCDGQAVTKQRRVLGVVDSEKVTLLWKELAFKNLERNGKQLDLDFIINKEGFMCKKCYYAYEKVTEKKMLLESGVDKAISNLFSRASVNITSPKRPCSAESTVDQPPAKKARKLASALVSSTGDSLQEPILTGTLTNTPSTSMAPTSSSPSVSISLEYKKKTQKFPLTPSRKYMGRAIARRSRSALVAEILNDPISNKYLMQRMGSLLRKELIKMCSDQACSILKSQSVQDLESFSWSKLHDELSLNAPLLLSLLKSCTATRMLKPNRQAAIGMCIAVLLKFRYSKMNIVQRIISMILYSGHSSKQVYQRLQKINVALSYSAVIKLVYDLSVGHDSTVIQWRDKLAENLAKSHCEHNLGTIKSLSSEDETDKESSSLLCSSSECSSYSGSKSADVSPTHLEMSEVEADEDATLQEDVDEDILSLHALQRSSGESGTENQIVPPADGKQKETFGYKLVGDNIDKGVKTRFMRNEKYRDQSLHYFHSYAVLNRIDLSEYPDIHQATCLNEPRHRAKCLLPSVEDDAALLQNLEVLVSRVLIEHIPYFKLTFEDVVTWHIKHKYRSEMSSKSVVVPLGVLLKNENKGDEMVDIVEHLHKYIPTATYGSKVYKTRNGDIEVPQIGLKKILFGGDQLTAARCRGAKRARMNSLSPVTRLEGLVPCAEDFHVKLNFLDVVWKYFYSKSSAGEHGTMYQLRNLIGRSNVTADPVHKYNECDDFFKLLVICHILTAALETLNMSSLNQIPQIPGVATSDDLWMETQEDRKSVLMSVCGKIINNFASFKFNGMSTSSDDRVLEYSKMMTSIGIFYLEFSDSIKEGDGKRVLRCWRYLLPLFKSSGRKNYAVEVLQMLCQYEYELTPKQAQELIWSRFVSTHDAPGHNIPCDLHQEHLNRMVKDSIRGLHSNKTTKSITKVGKILGTLSPLLTNFDDVHKVTRPSAAHNAPSFIKDRDTIIQHLLKSQVLRYHKGRSHRSFPKPRDVLNAMDHQTIIDWIKEKLK